jgi:DNA-binding beta-propeller fold protein YncE
MRPQGNCELAYLGVVNFNALTQAELQSLTYSSNSLIGTPGPTNQMVTGAVFAVHNRAPQPAANFDYAKILVVVGGVSLQLQWVTYKLKPAYRVLGTGYNQPEDIVLTPNGATAYVTERAGNLLRVNLANANRAQAVVVASGMVAPQQLALDEAHSLAYVVEYNGAASRFLRIDLTNGNKTQISTAFDSAVGLLMTSDFSVAYVGEQTAAGGRIVRVLVASGQRQTLPPTLTAPFFMTWNDPSEGGILVAERDPANRVTLFNLTQTPVTATQVVSGVAFRPSSVAPTSANRILVCSDQEIDLIDLTGSVFTGAGPMLMGIGHVPKTKIVGGYATTDPGYFFQVTDSPFGSTLALMFNHDKARSLGGAWYQVLVDGMPRTAGFNDYKWNSATMEFDLTAATQNGAFLGVRLAGDIWYNYWLGDFIDTTAFPDGSHTVSVRLFSAPNVASEIPAGADSVVVQIDNTWPRASIDTIYHLDPTNPNPALRKVAVGTCGIVQGASDQFSFLIEADDPVNQHMMSWSLWVVWGDNKSAQIASDSYVPGHVSPTHHWLGIHAEVPASAWHATIAGDPTSRQCAHTFYLGVWDRVIDGWNYVHYASYSKSITLLLS